VQEGPGLRLKVYTRILRLGAIKQGIPGGFSGKAGTVIGSSRRGIQVMRGLSTGRKGSPTDAQLQQQAKFAVMIKLTLYYLICRSIGLL